MDTDLTAVVPATLLVLQARKCRGKQEGHHGCFRAHNLGSHQCRTAPVSCLAMQEHIGHADSEPGNHAPCSSCSLEGALGGDHLPCPGCREGQLQGGPAQKSSSASRVTKGSRPHRVTWACSRISACRCWGGACQADLGFCCTFAACKTAELTATVNVQPGHTASLTLLDLTNCTDEADLRRRKGSDQAQDAAAVASRNRAAAVVSRIGTRCGHVQAR